MELCIFAETVKLDQKAYEKLVERIFVETYCQKIPVFRKLENLIIRGKGDLVTQLPFNLRTITRKYPDITCVIIFTDADGEYPDKTNSEKRRVKTKIKSFESSFPGNIIISVPTKNIEAWLLGDIRNINITTGLSLATGYSETEKIIEPKEKLKGIYTRFLKSTSTPLSYSDFVTKLFSTINLSGLKSNSKTFDKLLKDIHSYLRLSGNL